MPEAPFISICIPAYKRTEFLKRLLDSITIQTFTDFEVVVTDDSPGNEVKALLKSYERLPLKYVRNQPALGTPENWNEGLRNATGKWIKIMHDDDWFATESALTQFAQAARSAKGDFIFSAYINVFLDKHYSETVLPSAARLKWLAKNPATLFSKNIIGPPSVIMHKNDQRLFYDRRTKWVVDIDFYIRRLASEKINYIPCPLVNVGMSSQQVTVDCVLNRTIQLPENFYLLNKIGTRQLSNVLVYDAWWRLFRNLEVRNCDEIRAAGYDGAVHPVLQAMIKKQSSMSRRILTTGILSKISMFAHYLIYRSKIS